MLEQFHFVHPLWLLALLPLGSLVWLLKQRNDDDNAWRRVVDPNLLPLLLLNGKDGKASHITLWLLGAGWLIAVLALADPTWEKWPQPLFETQQARVIVLDLSRSMNAGDLKPSRLLQARLKVEDILDHKDKDEGQTGLVVFAGDAFSVAPLTRDAKTIRAMLRVLEPDLMPAQGSRADLGLKQAGELLRQAGIPEGEILLIADGIQNDAAIERARKLNKQGYRVSVLGVGTAEGAVVPDGHGGNLSDRQGNPVIARLDEQRLRQLAEVGGGHYARLQSSDRDLEQVLAASPQQRLGATESSEKSGLTSHAWKEQGPLLVVVLLPLAALAFRRGWLLSLLLAGALMPLPEPATAATWDDLWKRQDQRAAEALASGDAETAAKLARDPLRQGSAEYRRDNYQAALQAFKKAHGPEAAYNRGNTLARLGKYKEAIAAYEQALKQVPDMDDARVNKEAIEKLLQQRRKNQQQQNRGQQGQQDQSSGKPDQKDSDEQGQKGSNEESQADSGEHKSKSGENKESQSGSHEQSGEEAESKQGARPGKEDKNQFAEALKKQPPEASANGQKEEAGKDQTAAGNEDRQMEKQKRNQARPGSEKAQPSKDKSKGAVATDGQSKPLSSEEQLAAEQWLRRIPDDPGGLLRRKFLYQYQQRQSRPSNDGQAW